MLGGKELKRLEQQKRALVAESELNRLTLAADIHNLRFAASQLKDMVPRPGRLAPLLLALAPLARLFFRKKANHPASWLSRLMAMAKWVGPAYSLWRGFMAGRRRAEDL